MLFGVEPVFPIDAILNSTPTPLQGNEDRLNKLYEYRELVKLRQEEAYKNLKAKTESKQEPTHFLPGTKVLLKRLYTSKDQCAPLSTEFEGPYTVVSQVDPNSYIIAIDNGKQQHVPINRIKLYIPDVSIKPEFQAKYRSFLRDKANQSLFR